MSASVTWVVPAVSDLKDALVSRAIEAFRTSNLAVGQADPFTNSMHMVATRIRAEIARHQVISLTDYAIPPSLMWIACLLIIELMQGRLPGVNLTPQQQKMLDDGRDYLKRINRGDVQVEYPDDPMVDTVIQIASRAEIATSRCRVTSVEKLSGL